MAKPTRRPSRRPPPSTPVPKKLPLTTQVANAARGAATHVAKHQGKYAGGIAAGGLLLHIFNTINEGRQRLSAPATLPTPTAPRDTSVSDADVSRGRGPYPTSKKTDRPADPVEVESGTLTPAQKARAAVKAKIEADKQAAELANNPYKNSSKLVGDEAKYPRQSGPTGLMGARQFDDYLNSQLANPNSSLSQGLLQMRAQSNTQRNAMMRGPNENADEWNGRMIGMGQMRPEHAGIPDMSLWNRDAWTNDSDAYERESLNRTGVFDSRTHNLLRKFDSATAKADAYAALKAKSLVQSSELGAYPDRASAEHAKRLASLRAGRNAGPRQMGSDEFMTDEEGFDFNTLLDGDAPWDAPASPRRSPDRLMPWRDFEIGR